MFAVPTDIIRVISQFLDIGYACAFAKTCRRVHGIITSDADFTRRIEERGRIIKWLESGGREYKLYDGTYLYAVHITDKQIITASWRSAVMQLCLNRPVLRPFRPETCEKGGVTYVRIKKRVWTVNTSAIGRVKGTTAKPKYTRVIVSGKEYNILINFGEIVVTRGETKWKLNDAHGSPVGKLYCVIDNILVLAPEEPLAAAYIATNFHPVFQWVR